MADVQPDRHFLRLHRDILTALCAVKVSRTALRVALAIVRASYGFNEPTTGNRLHVNTLSRLCGGLDNALVRRALRELEDYGIVDVVRRGAGENHTATEYALVKDWESWAGMPRGWEMLWGEKPPPGLSSPPPPDSTVLPPRTEESSPPGLRSPPLEERERREREKREPEETSGADAPAQPAAPARKTAAQIRNEQAEQLVAEWYELSGTKRDKKSRADRLRLECAVRVIKDHGYEAIRDDLHALASDPWWRGRNRDGGDVFKDRGPTSFWGKAKRDTITVRLDERARGVRLSDSSAVDRDQPERPYQDWSWFESQLRARADDLAMTPEQVTPEWARKHREWHTVPGWVFDRALEATKEARSARY